MSDSKPKACKHEHLEFADMGLRLECGGCGATFVLETAPKSWMAAVHTPNILLPGEKRSSPLAKPPKV